MGYIEIETQTRDKQSGRSSELDKRDSEIKELRCHLVRKSWNATQIMEVGRRLGCQYELRTLWAGKQLVDLDLKTSPTVDFS